MRRAGRGKRSTSSGSRAEWEAVAERVYRELMVRVRRAEWTSAWRRRNLKKTAAYKREWRARNYYSSSGKYRETYLNAERRHRNNASYRARHREYKWRRYRTDSQYRTVRRDSARRQALRRKMKGVA